MEANYFTTYLKTYLVDIDNPLKDDEDFIESRADTASEEYESQRHAGLKSIQPKNAL